jgi:TonB family protein
MKKNNSDKLSIIQTISFVPVLIIGICFNSCSNNQEIKGDMQNTKVIEGRENQVENEIFPIPPPPPPSAPLGKIFPHDDFESNSIRDKPEFPGGDAELLKYVAKKTVYPKEAKEKRIQGTVYVRFVVAKTGAVDNITIMRPANPILEAEAIRVIKSLPKWKPGMENGQPVAVNFIIPVKFNL